MKQTFIRTMALASTTILLGLASNIPISADLTVLTILIRMGTTDTGTNIMVYHHWEQYHGHDGYWNRRSDGVRIFINI